MKRFELDKDYAPLKEMSRKIKVKNKLTYPAMFIFGTDTRLKVSSHAILRNKVDTLALQS